MLWQLLAFPWSQESLWRRIPMVTLTKRYLTTWQCPSSLGQSEVSLNVWETGLFQWKLLCRTCESYWQGQLMPLWTWRWIQASGGKVRWNPQPCVWMTTLCLLSLGEPISSEHFHRAVNVNDEDLLLRILEGGWESAASFSIFLPLPSRYTDNTRHSFILFLKQNASLAPPTFTLGAWYALVNSS